MPNFLDRFKELDDGLKKIKKLSEMITVRPETPGIVDVELEKGTGKLVGIAKCEDYSIAEFIVDSHEAEMGWHRHDQTEIIIVLNGKIIIEFKDDTHTMYKYDSIIIHKGIKHKVLYPEPGKTLAIIAPVEKMFPEGR